MGSQVFLYNIDILVEDRRGPALSGLSSAQLPEIMNLQYLLFLLMLFFF